jgi:predicted ATPase
MIETNWYVITGGPSSGKTTLIDHLAQQGFYIAPEIAREHIERFLANNHTFEDLRHETKRLQRDILAAALKRERKLPPTQEIFFDRGTTDSVGYFHYYGMETHQIIPACQYHHYKKIFYCHPLTLIYDEVRIEDTAAARKISDLIYNAYKNMGYQLIELPPISVEERVRIILSHLE